MRNRKFAFFSAAVCVAVAVFLVLPLVRCCIPRGEETSAPRNSEGSGSSTQQALIKVEPLCQYPLLPTGCESAAAVMVLNFYGDSVDMETFADVWLPKSSDFYTYMGEDFGPDPEKTFVGDPFTDYGYGCYAPVIAQSINTNSRVCNAYTVIGKEFSFLLSQYIDKGMPVLVWATTDMKASRKGASWTLPQGESFTWISGEHCLVLTGYDKDYCYFNDPLSGERKRYKISLAEKRYNELGKQALVITEKNG